MFLYLIVALISYLLGSIPFGYMLVRLFRGEDVRSIGSGNIGATNVARKSPVLGIATLFLDAAKGFAAVAIASRFTPAMESLFFNGVMLYGINPLPVLAAVCAILGHMFPVWLRFRGGKGVATGVGAFLAVAPKAVAIVLLVFAITLAVSRYVSLASVLATAFFPLAVWILYGYDYGPLLIALIVAAALLIILKHRDNIRRLLAGTEHRFELKRGVKA